MPNDISYEYIGKNHTYKAGEVYGCNEIMYLFKNKNKRNCAHVRCILCGREQDKYTDSLMYEKYNSCICKLRTIGGDHTSRLYHTYSNMLYRCNTPTCSAYFRYGANGVKVCDEWSGENGYMNFKDWALANGYADNLTIDRINNKGDYCPSNCQWVTRSVNTARANKTSQHRHNNSNSLYYGIDPDGNKYIFENANQFAREHGLTPSSICACANHSRNLKTHHGWKFGYEDSLYSYNPQSTIEITPHEVEESRVHAG